MLADEFKYNEGVGFDEKGRKDLKDRYPLISFALGQPGAGSMFVAVDDVAKKDKMSFRRFGYWSVALATVALSLAAIELALVEPAVQHGTMPKWAATIIAGAASVAGLLSVLISWAGLGITERKRRWLRSRLLAERMRQWQWQFLIGHIGEIATASRSPEAANRFGEERLRAFQQFHADYSNQIAAHLNAFLGKSDDLHNRVWIDSEWSRKAEATERQLAIHAPVSEMPDHDALQQLFKAYDTGRFQAQINYADYLLGEGPFETHAVTQKKILHGAGLISVATIVFLHTLVVIGVFASVPAFKSPGIYVVTLVLALIALAVRALEDGLRPTEQIVRLNGYREEIAAAQRRFQNGDFAQKVEAMCAMEDAASREMVEFLRSANAARYVM